MNIVGHRIRAYISGTGTYVEYTALPNSISVTREHIQFKDMEGNYHRIVGAPTIIDYNYVEKSIE